MSTTNTRTRPQHRSESRLIGRRARALAAVAAATATGIIGVVGAGSQAFAAPASPAAPAAVPAESPFPLRHGIVDVASGLTARSFPTFHSPAAGSYRDGARIDIDCKMHGPNVNGNNLWYGVPVSGPGEVWVSARYVANDGPAPDFCNPSDGFFTGTTAATLNQRSGPSTSDAIVGRYARRHTVDVACFVGPARQRWYSLRNGHWVSARYVSVSPKVVFCSNQ